MNIPVAALTTRLPEVMEALEKKERIVLSHDGKEFALLQPVFNVDAEIRRISKLPAVGIWADREDMRDPGEWVRKQRRRRRERFFETADGEEK